jgi:hypothetical protein
MRADRVERRDVEKLMKTTRRRRAKSDRRRNHGT